MSKNRDYLIADLKGLKRRGDAWRAGTYRMDYGDALRFSCDLAEEFEKEPELFNDPEVMDLLDKAIEAMGYHFKAVIKSKDWFSLRMAFSDAREWVNYDHKYFWLWYPESVMTENELKEWHKFLKEGGYKTI